jgi:hypothetical protein
MSVVVVFPLQFYSVSYSLKWVCLFTFTTRRLILWRWGKTLGVLLSVPACLLAISRIVGCLLWVETLDLINDKTLAYVFFDLCHKKWGSVENGQAANICESANLPRRDRYLQVKSAWQVDCFWNVIAHAQKTGFVYRRKWRVYLNRRGRQFSRLLAAEVCTSVVVILDIPCFEVVWSVLATHSIRKFPLHFPSRASPCTITFQLDSTPVVGITSCQYVC